MSDKALPNWVKVSKKRFDTIKNAVQNAKRNNLQARPQHVSPINFDNLKKLIHDIVHGNITYEDALNKMADTDNNFTKITERKSFNPNQIQVVNTYFMVSEITTGKTYFSLLKNIWKIMKVRFIFLNQKVIIPMNKKNQTQQDKDLPSNQMNNQTL